MNTNLLILIALAFAQNNFAAINLPAGRCFSEAIKSKKVVKVLPGKEKEVASEAAPSASSTGVLAGALAATGNLFTAMAAQAGGGDIVAMKIDKVEVCVDSNLTCSPTVNFIFKIGDYNTFCVIQ